MLNGIYSFHFQGQYCECKFINGKLINAYVDYFGSNIELNVNMILIQKNIKFIKKT